MKRKTREEGYKYLLEKNNGELNKIAVKVLNDIERISELMIEDVKQSLNEISLSRVWSYTKDYDIAIISASRSLNIECYEYKESNDEEGKKFTKEENSERTKQLSSTLLYLGYGVVDVLGDYIENFKTPRAVSVTENSMLVINYNKDENFLSKIFKISRYFCQDSVLLKPLDEDAYLIGTNKSKYPGYEVKQPLGKYYGGVEDEFMTRVGKSRRPLVFKEDFQISSRYLMGITAKEVLKNIEDEK
jgi:hypothetical protein